MDAPVSLLNSRDVFTVTDLQAILCIGRSNAYELVRTGEIESFHPGKNCRSIRIRRESLIDFINKNRFFIDG